MCGRWLPRAEPSSRCRGREFSLCSRGWDPCRPPCCCVPVTGVHGCSGGGRRDSAEPQHSFLWRDRGPGAEWHLVLGCVPPPRAPRPPCLSERRSDGLSAGGPCPGRLQLWCLRTRIVTLAVLSLFCAPGTVPAPRKPPVNSLSRRKRASWCCSRFI